MSKISIVIVTWPKEHGMFNLLSASMIKFLDPTMVGEIIVVNNSNEELDLPPNPNQSIINFQDLTKYTYNNGYLRQQALKILVAKHCQFDNIMLLDTKNFFTRPVISHELFRNGKPRSFIIPKSVDWNEQYAHAYSVFGLPLSTPRHSLHTPFLAKKEDLLDLAESFPIEMMLNSGKYSEFTLIHSYALAKDPNYYWYSYYDPSSEFERGVYVKGIWPNMINMVNQYGLHTCLLKPWMVEDDIFCTGIHRDTYNLFNKEQINQLINIWVNELKLFDVKNAEIIINLCRDISNYGVANLIPEKD